MPKIELSLSDLLYQRLAAYARDDAGTTVKGAAIEILEQFLAPDSERDPVSGELLYDRDDGHQYNPEYLNGLISSAQVTVDYKVTQTALRNYLFHHPKLWETGDVVKLGNSNFWKRSKVEEIWGKRG